jgi:inorganic triphosphatase YgiF
MMTLATLSKLAGAVHRWEKCEILLASDRRPANWPESPIRTRMLQLTRNEHLVPLVWLQQTRIIRSLCRNEQEIAVVRLDSVGYKNGASPQVRFEMEVELTPLAGIETLIDIVEYLEDEWDLWPERETKFERAYTAESKISADRYNTRVIRSPGRLRSAS